MKVKNIIITSLFCAIILCLYFIKGSYENLTDVKKIYNVYLGGKVIGYIDSKDDLYNLIDQKQQGIKDKYQVNKVYPPSSLQVVENYSYNTEVSSLNEIYDKIEELQDFTIKGYEIQISKEEKDPIYIYVLDKKVLEDAVKEFILAFISEEDLETYMNGKQKALDDIGTFYDKMGIDEDITVREKYISVNNIIYENSDELAQELLFGFNYKEKTYVVKEGDTIESISENNTLNTQEFLIANPKYVSKDSLLAVGEKVNVNLIAPEISFTYSVSERTEKEYKFETEIKRDNTKDPSYHEITQPGVNGIYLETSHYNVTNGEQSTQVDYDKERITIRETVNQIETRGRVITSVGNQTIIDNGEGWKWPTSNPFMITSEFAYRWGKHHNGLDISGTEFSNIFAVTGGTVIEVVNSCPNYGVYGDRCGGGFGNHVVIDHGNGLYTTYAHMSNKIPVVVGEKVNRASVIGYMSRSGSSTGVHLHFGVSVGSPTNYVNPRGYLFR